MRDLFASISEECGRGDPIAVATVVRTWRSAPRPAGSAMAVTVSGEAIGSISGGCVEAAVYSLGQEVLDDGRPRYESFGVSDDDAFSVGLVCGGEVEVFVERITGAQSSVFADAAAEVARGSGVALVTVIRSASHPDLVGKHLCVRGDAVSGTLGSSRLDDTIAAEARGMLASGASGIRSCGVDGERLGQGLDIFIASYAPPARLVILGAIDYSDALARVGKLLGFHVTVCDARSVFATRKRLPHADVVVTDWPHRWLAQQPVDEGTAICVLTHDPKFDVPALQAALNTRAGYIGAMGSRVTHADRERRLREVGVSDSELARINSPIGLDLGARTPEETAISIAAEIIKTRWGGSGLSLAETSGPIHHDSRPLPDPLASVAAPSADQ